MTDLRRAAEQALEALEEINKLSVGDKAVCLPAEIDGAMEALRQALAQSEQEPVATVVARQYEDGTYAGNALDWAGRNCEDDLPVGTKLYTSQHPKQEQEPFCYHDGRNIVGKEFADHSDVFPLYTSPQPRQWIRLSDAEIHNMTILMGFNPEWVAEVEIVKSIVRNLEAKLKEKNT